MKPQHTKTYPESKNFLNHIKELFGWDEMTSNLEKDVDANSFTKFLDKLLKLPFIISMKVMKYTNQIKCYTGIL